MVSAREDSSRIVVELLREISAVAANLRQDDVGLVGELHRDGVAGRVADRHATDPKTNNAG